MRGVGATFTGAWSPWLQRRVQDWCLDVAPEVNCESLTLRESEAAGSGHVSGTREVFVGGDASGPHGEMIVKRELMRSAVEPVLKARREDVLARLKQDVRQVYNPVVGAMEARKVPSKLALLRRLDDSLGADDALALVGTFASEMAAGATIGHRRGGFVEDRRKRFAYYAEQGYGSSDPLKPNQRSALVGALEAGIASCRSQRSDPRLFVGCVVDAAAGDVFDAAVQAK